MVENSEQLTYEMKTSPFSHQQRLFDETRDMAAYGLLWEQGCGKSKPIIDTLGYLWLKGEVDGFLLVAPGTVERNWADDELPAHMPDSIRAQSRVMVWQSGKANAKYHQQEFDELVKHDGLAILCISYHAFMTKRGKMAVWRFLKRRRCLYTLDESDDIKTPAAKRTRSIGASGVHAPYRRIATGTPADKPFDIYSQLRFLDPGIWRRRGMETFAAFKQHYARWLTREESVRLHGYDPGYDELIEYKNLDELASILASMSDRLLKEDVLDLPPKLYTKRHFDLAPDQKAYYNQLRDELEIMLADGRYVDGNMPMVKLLRLQQIACGYMVTDAGLNFVPEHYDMGLEPVVKFSRNARLEALEEICSHTTHQAIIWARFRPDIDQIMDVLGGNAVRFDGALNDEELDLSKRRFRAGEVQWFVGNPAKGARGLTLNQAKSVIYYSNSFKLRDRLQSEDRAHRIGQEGIEHEQGHGVLYIDLVARGTVDNKIIGALRDKFDIASQLTRDKLREWI